MGFDVVGIGLGVLGLDLSALGRGLNVLGLDLRFQTYRFNSKKVSGSLAFRVRYFFIIGLSLRASNREYLQFAPLVFRKMSFKI